MELHEAHLLALDLMEQFGLLEDRKLTATGQTLHRWRFEFDNASKRFGCAHMHQNLISLSRELVLRNDRVQVEDTIRHEIAHALCPPKSGHGADWKEMCARTGAKPERCCTNEVNSPEGDWSATCGGCGRVFHKFRRPKSVVWGWCSDKKCKAKHGRRTPLQQLTWRHKDALPEILPSPEARRAAIDAMKALLRREEPTPEIVNQCAKCDRKSISFAATCPTCGGDMMPEKKLQAEKEALKRRIAELERKAANGKRL